MRVTLSNNGCLLEPDTSREQDVIQYLATALKQTYDRPIVSGEATESRLDVGCPTTVGLASTQAENRLRQGGV